MQVLTLDIYNGNRSQVESYRQITGVTTPLLLQGRNGNYAGARLEDIIVVDQKGIVRYATNMNGVDTDYTLINRMVDALINKSAVINLSLRQLYFGTTLEVGQSRSTTLKISNVGEGPLEITGYTAPKGITMEPTTVSLGINETRSVKITFTPIQSGPFSGSIILDHNDKNVGTLQVPIMEISIEPGQMPSIALMQENLTFGEIEVGRSTEKTFTITNGGPGPLNITDIQSSIPGVTLSETQFIVSPGDSKNITAIFNPQSEGTLTGTLNVLSNDPANGTLGLSFSGSAVVVPADPRADFDGSGKVDFPDFLAFVRVFGTTDATYDLDGSNQVDFGDFLIFVKNFGKTIN